MPPRHISPKSFDDILSELGDDPAIPDPHGIRKASPPPRVDQAPQTKTPKPSFSSKSFGMHGLNFSSLWLISTLFFLLSGGGLFFYLESNKSGAELELRTLQSQLSSLKDEFDFSQDEWASEREDLYDAIDKLEVSVHSLNINPPIQTPQNKPVATPYEAELRRWRYLGVTRMGAAEQAFFHTGKSTMMMRREEQALGEWRLTQAEKELAVLTHPKGKSITFKPTQSK
jgi:hypothetical protein